MINTVIVKHLSQKYNGKFITPPIKGKKLIIKTKKNSLMSFRTNITKIIFVNISFSPNVLMRNNRLSFLLTLKDGNTCSNMNIIFRYISHCLIPLRLML